MPDLQELAIPTALGPQLRARFTGRGSYRPVALRTSGSLFDPLDIPGARLGSARISITLCRVLLHTRRRDRCLLPPSLDLY